MHAAGLAAAAAVGGAAFVAGLLVAPAGGTSPAGVGTPLAPAPASAAATASAPTTLDAAVATQNLPGAAIPVADLTGLLCEIRDELRALRGGLAVRAAAPAGEGGPAPSRAGPAGPPWRTLPDVSMPAEAIAAGEALRLGSEIGRQRLHLLLELAEARQSLAEVLADPESDAEYRASCAEAVRKPEHALQWLAEVRSFAELVDWYHRCQAAEISCQYPKTD